MLPADQGSPAIALTGCSVDFGGTRVLHDVDLRIAQRAAVALLGPSGCGKTTLLRAISGSVAVGGRRSVIGRLGIVYQDLKLLPWLTVYQNVQIGSVGAEMHADPGAGRKLLEDLNLAEKTHAYPRELSGGQKQRVAIARALVAGADILLLDEPFSALDFLAKQRLVSMIGGLRRSSKLTLVMVTHDIDDALNVASRIIIMRDGRIVGDIDTAAISSSDREDMRRQIMRFYEEEGNVSELR